MQHNSWQKSTYRIRIAFVCQAPSRQLLLVSTPCPTWAHDSSMMDHSKAYLRYIVSYMRVFFTFVSQTRINCYQLSYCSYISKRRSRKRRSLVHYRYLPMDVLQITSMNNRNSTYHTVIGYRMHDRSYFSRRLRMSAPYSEEGMNVPTFNRFCVYAGRTNPRASYWTGLPR